MKGCFGILVGRYRIRSPGTHRRGGLVLSVFATLHVEERILTQDWSGRHGSVTDAVMNGMFLRALAAIWNVVPHPSTHQAR